MIQVTYTIEEGHINLSIRGHAGYDEPGKDIICAAVSAITQTAILGLEAVANTYPDYINVRKKEGDESNGIENAGEASP